MYDYLPSSVQIIAVPFAPFKDGVNRNFKLTPNVTFGEIYDASFHTDKSKFLEYGIPLHKNVLKVHSLLRSYTNAPLYFGSLYRTYEWEKYKNRSGNSQHLYGAADFNGSGLNELIRDAVDTKNELFQKLQQLGVTAFGEYDWGWHLDFRSPKENNEIYYWSKKKS